LRYRASLAIIEQTQGPNASVIPILLLGMGQAELDTGQLDAAAASLRDAVRRFAAQNADPEQLANARFALAQALWRIGREREHARSLGHLAMTGLPKTERGRKRHAEIESWLATHGERSARRAKND
jgi:hypothetical protein